MMLQQVIGFAAAVLVIAAALAFLIRQVVAPVRIGRGRPPSFPYGMRDAFLSPAEHSFFQVLKGVLGPEHYLIAKVNLADLFFIRRPHVNRAARNRIDRKHVDFVICDALTMRPVLGVELDDSSHQRPDRQVRDAFVDQVFAAAGLPLLHVKAARAYPPQDLKNAIHAKLGVAGAPVVPPPLPVMQEVPRAGYPDLYPDEEAMQ